jgi:hypothetical protein
LPISCSKCRLHLEGDNRAGHKLLVDGILRGIDIIATVLAFVGD